MRLGHCGANVYFGFGGFVGNGGNVCFGGFGNGGNVCFGGFGGCNGGCNEGCTAQDEEAQALQVAIASRRSQPFLDNFTGTGHSRRNWR